MNDDISGSGEVLFEEVQRFRQWWVLALIAFLWLVVGGTMGTGLYVQLVQGQPFGNHPMSDTAFIATSASTFVVLGLVTLMVLGMSLHVRVEREALVVRFWPFVRRRIPWADVEAFAPVTYAPLREYGGWGIRGWGKNKAYNVSGDRGVRLRLRDDHRLLIGSQHAEEFAQAIARATHREPGGT